MLYSIFSPKNGGKRCEGEEREYKLCHTGVSGWDKSFVTRSVVYLKETKHIIDIIESLSSQRYK